MKISESWLREWVDPDLDTEALAHRLTMLGLEVDSVEPVAKVGREVVVGEVLEVSAHPNADRLSVCRVNVGDSEPLTIVCGAPNVKAGVKYPTALVGARLPGDMVIRRSKIRGEISQGMLCSSAELGLGEAADGIMELDPNALVGRPAVEVLGLDDHIIDIDLTPNRADCFSVLGVARDLACGQQLAFDEPAVAAVDAKIQDTFPVDLEKAAGCGRFVGRVIRNIDAAATTPLWMQERLRRSGIRPISPVVDVTNYVMVELGQPLHGYDLDKLSDGIRVRRGGAGEELILLDGTPIRVDSEVLVIADGSGAIGLGGIMGGQATAVSDVTTNVFLESAFFEPDAIAGRARRFGLHTDASVRFERGVDPMHQARAIERATGLLTEIVGGEPGPMTEITGEGLPAAEPITLRKARLAAVLGVEIPDDEVAGLLNGLKMTVQPTDAGWTVTAPSARFDIEIESDLIEEVVRLYGYEQIPEIPGMTPTSLGESTDTRVPDSQVRTLLVARGYHEAITYSFVSAELDQHFASGPEPLALSNPISSELAVMRQSLWPGLIGALRHNMARQQGRVKLFESGIRFLQQDTDIIEEKLLSGLVVGASAPEQWGQAAKAADIFDIKGDIEALFALTGAREAFEFVTDEHPAMRPGRSARIIRSGSHVGWLGELHPALTKELGLSATPILFELLVDPVFAATKPEFQGISKFPAVRRDVAVIVDRDIPVAALKKSVREAGGSTLRDILVFDIYEGKNIETSSKSVGLGLILQETSRTLTDADVDKVMHTVIDRLGRDFNATIRE
jgi:phenylalanyl-tRNA synthetase beta chain